MLVGFGKQWSSFTPTLTGFTAGSASISTEAGFGIYSLTGNNTASSFTHGLNKAQNGLFVKT